MDLMTLLRQLLGQQTQQYHPAPFYQAALQNYFQNTGTPVQNEGGIIGYGQPGNWPGNADQVNIQDIYKAPYVQGLNTIHPFQQQLDYLDSLLSQYAPPTQEYKVPFNQQALVPRTFPPDTNQVQFPNGNMLNLTPNQGTLR